MSESDDTRTALPSDALVHPTPPAAMGGYRLGAKLGQGGMATVYRAEQISLGRAVALKVIGPPHSGDGSFCERFLREARLAAAVNHPNIITVYDAGQDKQFLYMALELVGGGDAAEATTADGGRLEEARALRVMIDCCHGLIALDHAKLIHRDIKPANIFLTHGGGGERAKLADLGLARKRDDQSMTLDGSAMGTPAYMSPEQARGDADLDIRTDIYALGASLYALLTGQAPFLGTSAWTVVAQVLNTTAPDPRGVQPGISNASASIVLHCLRKDKIERYAHPQELLEDIERAAAGQPLKYAPLIAHPSTSWNRLTSLGPVAKDAARSSSTVDQPPPGDTLGAEGAEGYDENGEDDPLTGRGLWWIIGGVAVGVIVVVMASLANRATPKAPPAKPRSLETDLIALRAETVTDPLQPRTDMMGPDALASEPESSTTTQKPTQPIALPPPPLPAPVEPAVPVQQPQPQQQAQQQAPAVVAAPIPAPVEKPAPVVKPVEPAPIVRQPVAPEPEPQVTIAPPPGLFVNTAPQRMTHEEMQAQRAAEQTALDAAQQRPQAQQPAVQQPIAQQPPAVAPAIKPATLPTPVITPQPAPAPVAAIPQPVAPAQLTQSDAAIRQASVTARQSALDRSGFKCRLDLLPNGNVAVTILDSNVTTLAPLQGIQIERLNAEGCTRLTEVAVVTGMPIRELRLAGCTRLESLRGLRGVKLDVLTLRDCSSFTGDFTGIRGSQLRELNLDGCTKITTLSGLEGMPLQTFSANGCSSLTTIDGLRGCPLRRVELRKCSRIGGNLLALNGAPLEVLDAKGCSSLQSLEGLTTDRLHTVILIDCENIVSLSPLRGAKLTAIDISGCGQIRSLDGLQNMPLTELRMYGCKNMTGDFSLVRGAPLRIVDASYCSKMTSLNGLQDSPLQTLILTRNVALTDYSILAGIKGMHIER